MVTLSSHRGLRTDLASQHMPEPVAPYGPDCSAQDDFGAQAASPGLMHPALSDLFFVWASAPPHTTSLSEPFGAKPLLTQRPPRCLETPRQTMFSTSTLGPTTRARTRPLVKSHTVRHAGNAIKRKAEGVAAAWAAPMSPRGDDFRKVGKQCPPKRPRASRARLDRLRGVPTPAHHGLSSPPGGPCRCANPPRHTEMGEATATAELQRRVPANRTAEAAQRARAR